MTPKLQNYVAENIYFGDNKAPILHSVIFSEMNTASITNKRLL